MEDHDRSLINRILPSSSELQVLMKEHTELEKQLADLDRKAFLTAEDQVERKRLQKLKLKGRDRIEEILAPHRN